MGQQCKNIVFGRLASNAIGQIRSLGEADMHPIVVWIGPSIPVEILKSKWIEEIYLFKTTNEAIDWLVDTYRDESEKPVITTDTDNLVMSLNENFDRLYPYFHFFNAGENGRLSYFMKKERLCALAEECELRIPHTCIYSNDKDFDWGGKLSSIN